MEKIIRFPLPRGEPMSIEIPKNRVVQNSGKFIVSIIAYLYCFLIYKVIKRLIFNIRCTYISLIFSGGPLLSSRLYAPQQKSSFLDFSADENGLWTIMGTFIK